MTTRPDPPPRKPRQQAGAISTVLKGLRRRVQRGSRDVVETAVSQLFDAAVHPHGVAASGEYRIDDLARLAGTTTRNIRVYRDRGLLHPPLRVGRLALFNDTHLTRLRLITSLLDRGYNIAHVHEMLSAWEQGKDLGSVLGLESAIAGTWAAEKPQTMTVADAQRRVQQPSVAVHPDVARRGARQPGQVVDAVLARRRDPVWMNRGVEQLRHRGLDDVAGATLDTPAKALQHR